MGLAIGLDPPCLGAAAAAAARQVAQVAGKVGKAGAASVFKRDVPWVTNTNLRRERGGDARRSVRESTLCMLKCTKVAFCSFIFLLPQERALRP